MAKIVLSLLNVRFAERRQVICVFTAMMSDMAAYGFGAANAVPIHT